MLRYKSSTPTVQAQAPTNNGGFLGGLGYVGQKIGAGFMQTFEGVWDYTAGGIADIFGADEWAKRQMDEDWFGTWYSDIDKNFNPGKGWKIAGDVAGGIGNVGAGVASAALAVGAAVGITAATGGAALPVAASTIAATAGALTAGLGAAGNATKEAYRETGELTGKEYGYGALSGATEAALELATAGIGKGSGKLLKGVGKAVAGEATEEAAKVGAKAIVKEVAKDFASEAFEEGAAEYLTPKYKRMTYDPNAQDATGEEIAYAAFIGGLTGAVMNGASGAVTLTSDAISGKKAKASGQVELIEKLGKQISEEEAKSPSGYELLANIKKIYDRGGDSAVRVGQLKRMEAAARLLPAVEKSAMAIVSAPQYAVERFARMGVTEINGKALSAEMLTEAIDLDHGDKAALKTLRQAISKNPILATLAMADATAKLQLDSTKYTEGIASEGALGTSGDWNTFLATASAEEKAAVGKMFGVENIDALDYGTARAYAQAYAESDEGKATVRRAVRAKDAVESIAENDKPLPKVIVTTDGARRYGEVGIIKEGGEVRFYDYTTGRMTQPMTVREANAKLAQDRAAALSETATEAKTETKTEAKKPTADEEIHTWALENIKKYNELTGRERQEVRSTIRQARALGISEADTITYATVAARSGVRVVFSRARCLRRVIVDEGGKPVTKVGFSDGFYNHDTNEIVVNPEGKRSPTKLLLHELAHALYKNKGFARLLDRAAKKMDDDRKKEITNRYTDAGQKQYIPEEHAVHHAEDVIGNDATLERLLRDEPTMGDKILSFFGLAKTDYKGNERLSRSAGRLYARYKATFERFAAANRGTVRIEGIGDSKGIRDAFAGELSEKADKGMLAKAKAMLEGGADSEKVRQETGWFQGYDGKWRYEIDDSTAVWHLDTAKPDPKRLVHFGERIFKLTDLLDHPAMYEAYPQLKDVTVWENPDAPVDGYVVGKGTDHITVRSLSSMGDLSKDIVIHEVQHLIQNIEGFTSGASKDQFEYKSWGPKEWEAYEKRNEIAAKLYAVLRRHGEHITARDIAAMRQEFSETDSILDSNFMLLSSLADSNKRVDYLRDEYYKQVRILQLTTPSGQYHAVAGEIEAYDAQFRRRMAAEERKNTRPNIDREDAILIEGDKSLSIGQTDNGRPVVVVNDDITRYYGNDKDLIKAVKQSIVKLPYVALGRQKIWFMNDTKTEVTFSRYTQWLRKNAPTVYQDKMRLFNHPSEIVLATTNYINEGLKHPRRDNIVDFARGELLVDVSGRQYVAEVVIGFTKQGLCELHDVVKMSPTQFEYKKKDALSTTSLDSEHLQKRSSFDSSVAQSSEDVKTQGENNFAESTMAIRHAEDGAVVKSPVTEMVISTFKGGVRDSITTEFVALPKQEMSVTTGEGQIMREIKGIEATPVKGIGGQTIEGFTGREVREWAMGQNGFTAEQIENVDRFMDEMGKFMKKAGVTYRFIGLTDVENAKLHYTYDAQGNIKSIVLSAMVKNGDYPVNFDLSSICKKRVAMSTLIDKLANRGTLDNGTVALTPAQIFAINTALKNAGYETACLGCFVESKRYNAMAWAKSFVEKWNKAVKAVNPNATYFGYGDGTNTTEVTVAEANRIDVATKEYIAKTKTKRMEQALSKYQEKAAKGLPLISGKKQMVNGKEIETFTKAARDRLIKSETLSDALKERYLNADVSTLGMEDVETLLEHGVLPGASISNKQAVTELVKSGEAYQHLLRPSDLLTAKGIEKLEALPNFHGVLYGHYGSGTPKLMQSFTPYNSEIALLPSKKGDTGLAEYLYSIAGVRMQSFSDFQVQNIYDYLQMVADLAARKLPAHAYTKEISFAKLLGMTGIKVNLSVMFDIDPTVDAAHAGLTRRIPFIHKGEYAKVVLHDEQGDWVYNIGDYQTQRAFSEAYPDADLRFLQSIGFADAVKLQTTEGYSANCGIIGVGYSDLHILAMLDDNRIRYIIPYHASSLPADIKVATNIALGTDYTPYQNTMKIDSIVDKNGKTVEWSVKEAYRRLGSGKAVLDELNAKIKSEGWVVKTKKAQNGHGTFGLYEDLGKTSDPRKTAENFMDWCAGNGSLPLFYQFASHANYYKLLYDYNVYDCVSEQYAPQTAVTNTYPAGDSAKPTNAADTRFDTTYLTGVIDKQMSFMDRYSQNLDRDLDVIASKVERGDMSGRRDALPEWGKIADAKTVTEGEDKVTRELPILHATDFTIKARRDGSRLAGRENLWVYDVYYDGHIIGSSFVNKTSAQKFISDKVRKYNEVAKENNRIWAEKNATTQYSDRDDIGYHAGDLGKAEFYHQQGYSRDTGHFGTGTYFVGDEARISGDNTYGKRPHHAVDFSDYTLYKPYSTNDAYKLHDQLRVIDGGIKQEYYDAAVKDKIRLVGMTDVYDLAEKKFGDDQYTDEAIVAALNEVAKEHGIELTSREAFSEKTGIGVDEEDFMYYYTEELKNEFKEKAEKINSDYGDLRDAYFQLSLRFGSEKTRRAMQKTIIYQNELSPNGAFDYNALKAKRADSLATVFMKALGYEGIDVRKTGLDNTAYGSVIYDVKPSTVRYALPEDLDTFDISSYNEIKLNGIEAKRLQSEALTWDAGHSNEIRTRTLANGIQYRYYIDDESIVHCIGRMTSQNIHERRKEYDLRDREQLDSLAKGLRNGHGDDRGVRGAVRNGRKPTDSNRLDHRVLRQARDDKRADDTANGAVSDGNAQGLEQAGVSAETARALAFKERLLSKGYYEENGYIYAPDGTKTTYFFPEDDRRDALPSDAEYMTAVESGDMETAQRMVDAAANKAMPNSILREGNAINKGEDADGTLVKMFHGSGAKGFHTFETHDGALGKGIYLTSNWDEAVGYAIDKLGIEESDDGYSYVWNGETYDGIGGIGDALESNGYVRAFYANVTDANDITTSSVYWADVIALVRDGKQLKSADPVTYDDNGKVIPLSKRFDMENPDIRYALPEDATYVSPTAGAVGKTKAEYKATFGDKVFTASTRTYIDTVDELYGIETYLRKVGKMDKAAVEALVQQARAARSQAQTMIGTAQYNVFSDKVERMGDGLLEILKPTKNWTAKKKGAFDDYLLNQLNIDRMTLESRTTMWAAPVRARLAKQQSDLANLKKLLSRMERKVEDLATEIGNARGHRDTAKLSKTREKWRTRISELENRKSAAEALISQYEKDIKAASRAVDKTKAELDAMIVKDKPVFGKDETLDAQGNVKRDHDITADESRDIVKKYEAAYPEFAEMAKRLYAYLDNVQKLRVEAGLITQDMADHMKKLYPHYVPSYRDVEGGGISTIKGKNAMEVFKTVHKAQGGNQDILDVAVSIAMQTDEVLKAGQINKLARALYDVAKSSGEDTYVKILSEEAVGAREDAVDAVMRPTPGQLTFYADGKRVTMAISQELLYGFDGLRKPSVDLKSPVWATLAWMNKWFKRGVTSLNPAFALRNPIRDFQDAGLNSKHPLLFAKQMAGFAQKGIASNSERWELYRAMGGFSSTVFDGALHNQAGYAGFASISELFSAAKGETDLKAAWRKLSAPAKAIFRSVENANAFLEQTTRFAEFCASLDAGDSPAVALNNSAEVTTNFGRRGRITKVLNATVMPFLNPAVQGFDKLFRNVGDAFTGGHWVRGVATLITKAAIIGIAPMLLNSIMYDDDEEYEKLRETDKENNFLIKTADGTFIKIPRGRLASVIGGLYNRGDKLAKGEDAELAGYASNVVSQITPVENVSRTIFSPIFDVKNNRTWYGGEIEGREWDDTAPRDRYDESTSSIAVAIGQAINQSPKKVHYLLDQYSGVIGDFVLPATSKKEKRDFFSGNFTLDSVTSNKLSERFYDVYDKTAYADTAGDEAATYRLKYLNDVKKAVRDMNKELDEIRNSDLSNTEKLQQTRVVRSLINAAYDSALKSLDAVNAAIEETAGIEDEVIREAEINRRVFGAEYALKQYNEKTYEKYVLLNGGGIGYDELYAYHFATLGIESDLDKKGNVIEGSKKKKILAVINSLDIPKEQKLILLYSRGYSAKDGDIKGVSAARAKTVLAAYIAKAKGLTKAQREELAKACGLKVTNGRISVK